MNFKDLEADFITGLAALYNEEEAKQLYYLTVEHLSGLSRTQLLLNKEQNIGAEISRDYGKLLQELQSGRPIQHIFAEAWFYGLKFKVSTAVLIPRPETEELVEWIIDTLKNHHDSPAIIDIGTGSGCIAISLKKNLPIAKVSALDISTAALAIARENAINNGVEVEFIHSDILSYAGNAGYNLIVSNPPYITRAEEKDMHQNVLDHEPHLALFVSDENPLLFYSAIADFALQHLNDNGQLFFEINEYLGKETVDLLVDKGFKDIILKKDMQGKDRMISCSL